MHRFEITAFDARRLRGNQCCTVVKVGGTILRPSRNLAAVDRKRLQAQSSLIPAGEVAMRGTGKRLFGETSDKKRLRLTSSQTVGDGVSILVFERPDA